MKGGETATFLGSGARNTVDRMGGCDAGL